MTASPILPPDEPKQDPDTQIQRISERQVRRLLFQEKIQDRAVVISLGISAMALVYLLTYSLVLPGYLLALGIFILSGLLGTTLFLWQYVVRYQQNFALKSHELLQALEARDAFLQENRLESMHAGLERGLSEVKSNEGLRILHRLDHEYKELQPVLTSGKEIDLIAMSNLDSLVRETYHRGLSVLQDAFELERAVRSSDNAQLQSETAELQKKAAALRDDSAQHERLAHINERIQSNQERQHMIRKLKGRLEELYYQAGRCEASLGKTRIELAAMKADASEFGVNAVTDSLRRTIDRAREVQAELKKMGY